MSTKKNKNKNAWPYINDDRFSLYCRELHNNLLLLSENTMI